MGKGLNFVIAHRGNLRGPNKEMENNPKYIMSNLEAVESFITASQVLAEIDVRYIVNGAGEGEWWLGHDTPDYKVTLDFLKHPLLICHAKNSAAFVELIDKGIHCFWHQDDDYTLTSEGWIWAYPGKDSSHGIAVMPETAHGPDPKEWSSITWFTRGVCTDYVERFLASH